MLRWGWGGDGVGSVPIRLHLQTKLTLRWEWGGDGVGSINIRLHLQTKLMLRLRAKRVVGKRMAPNVLTANGHP